MAKMTIKRSKESAEKKVIMHRIADIRGGVGIRTAGLEVGDVIPEGTFVYHFVNGMVTVVKSAVAYESTSSSTSLKVKKGHLFKVGDSMFIGEGNDGNEITAINKSNANYDTITLTTAVSAVAGEYYFDVDGTEADIVGITGTTAIVESNANIQMDVWVMAVTKGLGTVDNFNYHGIINY